MLKRLAHELKWARTLLTFGLFSAVGRGLDMLAPLVLAKMLAPAAFASYSLAKMVVFFFLSLLLMSAQTPLIVYGSQERAERGKLNRTFTAQCVWLLASVGLYAAAAAGLAGPIMAYAEITARELLAASVAFVGLAFRQSLGCVLMALGQRVRSALAELAFGAASLGLVLGLYFLGRLSLSTLFLSYGAAAALLAALFVPALDFARLTPLRWDGEHVRGMLRFGGWMAFSTVAVYLTNWGHNFVLRAFVPMDEIGAYNFVHQVYKGLVMLIYLINAYFLPFVGQHVGNAEKMRAYLRHKRPRVFALGLAGIGAFVAVGPWALARWYPDYAKATAVLYLLLLAAVVVLYYSFYLPITNALKDYRFTVFMNVVSALLCVGASLALVPLLGATGAAWATVAAHGATAVALEVRYRSRWRARLGL